MALKVIPKIINVPLHNNNFEKMRLGYAFHIFSLDVVEGLSFYKDVLMSFGDRK